MDNYSFSSAEQKIRRAQYHTDDFKNKSSQFLKKYRKVVIYDNFETGYRTIRIIGDELIPDDFDSIIGDAFQNLRSALDHATCAIVIPNKPKKPKDVQYPFVENLDELEKAFLFRQINLAGPDAINIIRNSQPYREGDKNLFALHELSIVDRHKLNIKQIQVMSFGPMNLRDIDPSAPSINFTDGINITKEISWPLLSINRKERRANHIPANGTEVEATLDFVFGPEQSLNGAFVVSVLEDIITKVSVIVKQLKSL